MKWGVRRTPEQLGHAPKKKKFKITFKTPLQRREEAYKKKVAKLSSKEDELQKKEEIKRRTDDIRRRESALKDRQQKLREDSQDKPKTLPSRNKPANQLTDDEIRTILNRYNLEKQYNTMLSELNKKNIPAGQKKVQEILSKAATQVATTYATKAMTAAVEAALKKTQRRGRGGGGGGNP